MNTEENLQGFAEELLRSVNKKADGVFTARLVNNLKNNGVRKLAITAPVVQGAAPCLYLEEVYEGYKNGKLGFEEASDSIYKIIMEAKENLPDIDMETLFRWENVRPNIRAALINTGLNEERLSGQPNRPFLDLSIVYYMKMKDTDLGNGNVWVRNAHLECWQTDEETLYRTALENMRTAKETALLDMEKLFFTRNLLSSGKTKKLPESVYILTNGDKHQGAAAIIDEELLSRIQDMVGAFAVLPSSVHEVLIIRDTGSREQEKMAELVREVNKNVLRPEDLLSDHVYVYDRDKGGLRIAV